MKLIFATFLLGLMSVLSFSQIPPVIQGTFVQDHANVLTPEDEQLIQAQLDSLKQQHNIEFAIATVESTNGVDIYDYSLEMARSYGVGPKDGEKRGMLLLLAIKDRKYHMQISRHMEGVLTDGQWGNIGRNTLVPKMKVYAKSGNSSDLRDGILNTVGAINTVVTPRIEPERKTATTPTPVEDFDWSIPLSIIGLLGIVGIGGAVIAYYRNRKREAAEAAEAAKREAERRERERQAVIAYAAQAKREAEERERKRLEREAWLKTPEGIADTKRREEAKRRAEEEAARKKREHEAWLRTPEGIAHTAAMAAAARKAAQEAERREKAAQALRKRQEEEEAERRRRRRREEDDRRRSSSSSYSSSSYSSSDWGSSSSSSSGGFGGGGDFGGGGGGGSW